MKTSLTVRPYTMDDFHDLLTIQKEAFPPPFPEELWWSKEQIHSHVHTFRNGGLIAEIGGEAAGSATSVIIDYDGSDHTWEQIADNGYIKNSHDPNGDTLYGIDVCVRPKFRSKRVAKALYDARKQFVITNSLKRFIAGCRIPNFHEFAGKMTVDEYVKSVSTGNIQDLVLSFILKQGLTVKQIMPNYLDDEESLHYGIIVEWRNPSH
ncbi:GNAT family N-acetyltransferase [Evansella halocellulosilytica]|uniref:GNAT family N-acetyltransferase n=1 Tax=Evansella halocellulosilytica TaxID=2011013 RepID=UPI000BB70FF1|nr:GNAT family N-acetyltransferase [Evansella halocellulosilytica]